MTYHQVARATAGYVPGSNRKGMRPHRQSDIIGFCQGITDVGDEDTYREELTARWKAEVKL